MASKSKILSLECPLLLIIGLPPQSCHPLRYTCTFGDVGALLICSDSCKPNNKLLGVRSYFCFFVLFLRVLMYTRITKKILLLCFIASVPSQAT